MPDGVEISTSPGRITVKGPKGSLDQELSPDMAIAHEGSTLVVSRPTDRADHRALHGLTRSLARALAPVRVNEVAPGLVMTRWWAGNEERGRQLAASALLDRETTPDDVARAVLGLVESGAITGQTVVVDGGQTL